MFCPPYWRLLAGEAEDARRAAQDLLSVDPDFPISEFATKHPYRDRAKLEHLVGTRRDL